MPKNISEDRVMRPVGIDNLHSAACNFHGGLTPDKMTIDLLCGVQQELRYVKSNPKNSKKRNVLSINLSIIAGLSVKRVTEAYQDQYQIAYNKRHKRVTLFSFYCPQIF